VTREYTDDELVARAIENGWEQLVAVTDRFPGSRDYPWTGWLHGGTGSPVKPGVERTEWIGDWPNREKVTFVDSWAHGLRGKFDHEDRCGECGKFIEYEGFVGFERKRAPLPFCWDCKFWLERIPMKDRQFVAGDPTVFYGIGTKTRPSSGNGYAGRWFTVTFNDGRIVETCDLWFGGDIPERFQDRLPVNATLRSGRANDAAR
jgi:hypothetical protein